MSGNRRFGLDRERAGRALVLALAVQLLLTGLGGALAGGGSASEAPPAQLELPRPAKGDRGVYNVTTVEEADEPLVEGREIERISAEWHEVGWALTSNGSYEWTSWLRFNLDLAPADRTSGAPDSESRDPSSTAERMFSVGFRHADRSPTGAAWYEREPRTTTDGPAIGPGQGVGSETRWHNDLTDPEPPCGFLLDAHGHRVNLNEIETPTGCPSTGGNLSIAGVDEVAGARAIHLVDRGPPSVELWLAPSLALPLRWSGPVEELGLPGEGHAVLTLEGYAEGAGPTANSSHASAPNPFQAPTGPAQPWGPSERGLEDVAFPLSEAYRALVEEDEEVQSFQNDNPDAYVARAWMYKDRDAAERPRTTWQIVLTDGKDHTERFVMRSHPVEAPAVDQSVPPPARIVQRDEAPVDPPPVEDRYPGPADRPKTLPVIDGELVDQMTGGDTGGFAPWERATTTHYGLDIQCADPVCSEAKALVEFGVEPPESEEAPRGVEPWSWSTYRLVLGLDGSGGLTYIEGASSEWQQPELAGQDSPPDTRAPPSDGADWPFSSKETAAGAGVIALLTGLFYYFWPKLKFVAVGLYSRIGKDPDDVLENETRERVFDLIVDNPGIHFRELRRRAETGTGNLDHHLDKLERADLVTCVNADGYKCYFRAGEVDREIKEATPAVASETARTVLQTVFVRCGPSAKEIAEAADLSDSTAGYHLTKLEDAGLVRKDRDGRSLAAEVTELGRRVAEALRLSSDAGT